MERYENYKYSGIEWIGEIPEHWEVKKIKFISTIQGRIGFKGYSVQDIVISGEGALTLGAKHISKNNKIDLTEPEFISWDKYYESPEIMLKTGDILVVQRGSLGKVALLDSNIGEATINPSLLILRDLAISPEFLLYYLFSNVFLDFIKIINSATAVPMISQQQLGDFKLPICNKQEQTLIAAYLDHKTSEIDQIIANKQKLIALYEEEKQAIINQAVTASIQENVAYKRTSTDWLDEIPDAWQFLTMKRLVSTKITDGPHETPEFIPDGVPFLSAESVKNGKLDFDFRRGNISKELDELYSKKCKPKRDDIFIVKSGSTTGKIAIVDFDDDFNIWSPLALVRVNEKVKPYFLYYALQSFYFQKQIQLSWSFGTQPNIGMNVIENLKVAVPVSLDEQELIISYIETELKRLNEIILKFNKQIDLLQEYRTTLISEVVTGKIMVPENENK